MHVFAIVMRSLTLHIGFERPTDQASGYHHTHSARIK